MKTNIPVSAPDLTQRPPRSPRVRLGGYAMLPRVLDKARASLIGKAGDYKYGNPMDQHFFGFTGLAQGALLGSHRSNRRDKAAETQSPKRNKWRRKKSGPNYDEDK